MPRFALSKTFPLLLLLSLFGRGVAQESVDIPANPCPDVFSYVRNSRGEIMGKITLPNNGEGFVNLEINVSLATNTNSPKVELERMEQDLTDCQPSIYHLHLPFTNNIPRVTRILFNGNELCSGPKEPLIPGGRTVWNLWRQSSYETSERFTCRKPQVTPERAPQTNDLGSLSNNPFLTGRFPSVSVDTSTSPPFQPPPVVTRPTTRGPPPPPLSSGGGKNQCGIAKSNSYVTNLSFGGVDVPDGEFPWMGALMYRSDANAISIACTVTLITLRYVVTRGHCIDLNGNGELEKENLLVVLGTRDIGNWYVKSEVRNVSNIYIKPGIEPNRASHDVALIQMDQKVDYIPGKVVPICIWSGRKDLNENDLAKLIDRNPGTVVGWGATHTTTTRLNMIQVPVISHLTCIQSSSLPSELVGPNTFCGGYTDGQTGTCDTDAGASFCVQKDKGGPWFLRGILSITPSVSETECNLKGYSLYVDLAEHYQWMYNLISRDGF